VVNTAELKKLCLYTGSSFPIRYIRAVATAKAEEAHDSSVLTGLRQMRKTFSRFALPEPRKTYAGGSLQKNN